MKPVACVTGAASGIGLAIARTLVGCGYAVAMVDIRDKSEAEELMSAFPGNEHAYIRADIGNENDREKIFNAIKSQYGRLDILVNNAGVAPEQRLDILQTSEASYDRVMNINLKGPFFLTQLLANYMVALVENHVVDNPKIVNISSISAYTSSTSRPEYCISKAGVSMMTRLFADRLAGYGIHVYEIRPGIIHTPMTEGVRDTYDQLINEDDLLPTKRWGQPEDVALVIKAIVDGGFEYSTGQVFDVDGGFHIRRL